MSTPRCNRVTPMGDLVAIPLRGAWTGNRGRLHEGGGDDAQVVRFHATDLWITCALQFKDWWAEQWRPRHFTWLYFHDEAVSLAAGHRPCALCRRPDYNAFRAASADGLAVRAPSATEMNQQLHGERIVRGTHRRRTHRMSWAGLPDGTFVLVEGQPSLVRTDQVIGWTTNGYAARSSRPRTGDADVITPPSSVAVLQAGYPVQIDAAAAPGRRPTLGAGAATVNHPG